MCEFDVLYEAYLEARKGKRSKAGTAQYEANALACTEKLSHILRTKIYRPGKFETFYVYEPKKRLVQAPAFVDKVVLHAVVDNILYEEITKSFIRNNHASQKGKGTHDGLMRLSEAMLDYYRKNNTAEGWVLKGDVRHFFASIDHDILKKKLWTLTQKRGIDPQIYCLLCIYIDTTDGLPLGYQTSQLLALLFLDEFDHLLKEKYHVRYYGRYMDDFYVIAPDKKYLQKLLVEIKAWMGDSGLELNNKTGIFPLKNGIDFLGFHTYLTETGGVVRKLRRDSIDRIRAKVRYWQSAYPAGEITQEKILEQFDGWDAHAAHGDTYSLRLKYAQQVEDIIGVRPKLHRKINSTKAVREVRRAKQYMNLYKKQHPNTNPIIRESAENELLPWE
jgi:retron-type reverse transcriptase